MTYHNPGASEKCRRRKATSWSVSTGSSDLRSAAGPRDAICIILYDDSLRSTEVRRLGSTAGDRELDGLRRKLILLFGEAIDTDGEAGGIALRP